jgi:hypothetical protein
MVFANWKLVFFFLFGGQISQLGNFFSEKNTKWGSCVRFSPLLLTQNHSCSKFQWDLYPGQGPLNWADSGNSDPRSQSSCTTLLDLHCCQVVVLLITWIAWPAANETTVRLKFLGSCVEYTIKSTTTSSVVWAGSRLRHCQCAAS